MWQLICFPNYHLFGHLTSRWFAFCLFGLFLSQVTAQNECCLCDGAMPVQCGQTVEGHTANGNAINQDYFCFGEELTGFNDREVIFQIEPMGGLAYDLNIFIDDLDRVGLDLFLVADCSGENQSCIDFKERRSNSPQRDLFAVAGLDPTLNYFIIVDAKSGQGAFNLRIECVEANFFCEVKEDLNCGTTTMGNTAEGFSNYSNYSCFEAELTGFAARERVYQITGRPNNRHNLRILLNDHEDRGLDLFVIANCGTMDFRCIAYKERTSSDPQKDELIVSNVDLENEYYIIIDAKNVEGSYELEVLCEDIQNNCDLAVEPISCGEEKQLSTENQDGRLGGNFYQDLGIKGPCFPDFCCEYGHAEYILEFSVDRPQRVEISLNRLDDFGDTLGVFLFRDLCTEIPDLLSFVESDQRQFDLVSGILEPGSYEIVIDRKCVGFIGPIPFEFNLGLQCYETPNICDLAAPFIDRGDPIFGELTDSDLASSALSLAFCPNDTLRGNGQFADVYTYINKEDNLNVELQGQGGQQVFVFSCICSGNQGCMSQCEGSDIEFVSIDPATADYYYIVVIGDQSGPYQLNMTPSGPCTGNDVRQLSCGEESTLDLNDEINNFDGDDNNIYANCANLSNATFDGGDLVYSINFDQLNAVSLTLEGSPGMGMFVFNQDCGATCQNSAVIQDNATSAQLDTLPLSGLHYIIVDKPSEEGPGIFTLSVACEESTVSFFSFQSDCPDSPIDQHKINVQNLDATSIIDQQPIQPQDRIGFFYRQNEQLAPADEVLNWDPITGLEFNVRQDAPGDNLKCGFDLLEPFVINVIRSENGFPQSHLVQATYLPPGTDDINAEGAFIPDGISAISQLRDATEADIKFLATDLDYRQVNQDLDTVLVRVTSNVNWQVMPDADWISVDPVAGQNFDSLLILTTTKRRDDPIRATVRVVADNGLTRTIVIEQPQDTSVSSHAVQQSGRIILQPNPVADQLRVRVMPHQKISQIEIIDPLGRAVNFPVRNAASTHDINCDHFSPGFYLLRAKVGEAVFIEKFLVTR